MSKLAGKLTISRMQNNRDQTDTIRIRVEDVKSTTEFIEIYMTPEVLGLALTGLGYVDCTFDLYPANVGKQVERKTEIIPAPEDDKFWKWTKEQRREYLKAWEVDGWLVSYPDAFGSPRHKSEGGYSVNFVRWVEE